MSSTIFTNGETAAKEGREGFAFGVRSATMKAERGIKMKPEVQQIQKQLFVLQDKSYQAFQSKLMSTLPAEMKQLLRGLRSRS